MEFLDIIKRLNDRGAMHILTNIWRYLSAEEIGKAMQVSPHWNAAILTDRDAIEKYVEAKEIAMDQNTQSNKHICSRLKNSGPRKALGTLNLIGKFFAIPSTFLSVSPKEMWSVILLIFIASTGLIICF